MSLKRKLDKFEEGNITHKISCPSCGDSREVTSIVKFLGLTGIIHCSCKQTFAYKVTTKYEILTATVNEFKNNQL